MKKWIRGSFFIILLVFITCTAGAKPAVQSESQTIWNGMLFSYVKEQCTEAETGIITKPWVVFTIQSPSKDILTLEMENNNKEEVYLLLEYNNYLASLNVNDHKRKQGKELICATQIFFNYGTECLAIAGDEGLFIWWEQGSVVLPYNNYLTDKNERVTYYNENLMHLKCTAIKCHTDSTVEKASSNRGDTLYATTDGFQNESHSRHNLKSILYVIVFSLGIFLLGSIISILILKKINFFEKKQNRKKKQNN